MNLNQLCSVREGLRVQLLMALESYVRENGDNMADYYRDEHGIDEDSYGYDVVKILDTSDFGCCFPMALKINDDDLDNATTLDDLRESFEYHAFWSFYIAKDRKTGEESLYYYEFCCPGIQWLQEEAEPYHEPAAELSLEALENIVSAIKFGMK